MHCRMSSSFPGLYAIESNSTFFSFDNQKCLQRLSDSLEDSLIWVSLPGKLFKLAEMVAKLQRNPEGAAEEGDDDYSYGFRTNYSTRAVI